MHFKEAKVLLSSQNGMNISRGCIHGCIYCDSRSKCYNMEHEFEDVEIKYNAPQLLEQKLRSKRNKCMIGTGAMSDPYIPIKENLKNIRACLEIIAKYGFGLAIQTKSNLILNDLDLLKEINSKAKCVVEITLTTYDENLCKIIEPNVATTKERAEVLNILNQNGIKTIVWLCPILPYINDTKKNLTGLLNYCIKTNVYGIMCFGIGLTLRDGNREYFYQKLDEYFPGLKEKYINTYGNNYSLNSPNEAELLNYFYDTCQRNQILCDNNNLFHYMRTFTNNDTIKQPTLFD